MNGYHWQPGQRVMIALGTDRTWTPGRVCTPRPGNTMIYVKAKLGERLQVFCVHPEDRSVLRTPAQHAAAVLAT
jgi:hypothetical protein